MVESVGIVVKLTAAAAAAAEPVQAYRRVH